MRRAYIGMLALAAAAGAVGAVSGAGIRFSSGNGYVPKSGGGKGAKKLKRRHPQGRRRNR